MIYHVIYQHAKEEVYIVQVCSLVSLGFMLLETGGARDCVYPGLTALICR